MSKKNFPKRLYVVSFRPGTEDECLLCAKTVSELAEMDETVDMAVYELTEVGKATASPTFQRLRSVK